ncbi:hypothetical protein ACFYUD_04425 [Nocardia tengchongensis]|uniref:hypothetical protein n=1 Tax=Nocardia tengchongensis TaxID=2055889 RepID=UPI003681C102
MFQAIAVKMAKTHTASAPDPGVHGTDISRNSRSVTAIRKAPTPRTRKSTGRSRFRGRGIGCRVSGGVGMVIRSVIG